MLGQFDHPVVDLFGIERRGIAAIGVRVTDDQLAMGRGADQQVNAVLHQVRAVAKQLRLEGLGLRQVGEGAVMHAAQTGQQGMLQIQVETRAGTQHLQAADLWLQLGDGFGEQGLIVMPGTDHDLRGAEIACSGRDLSWLDIANQGGEMKLHIQFLLQEADQCGDGFTGVQLLVVQSTQGCAVVAKLAAI
ncbi:hypothetical protein D3C78_1109660 [compost metagenome]